MIQGSAIGPIAFICNTSDLHPLTPGNGMCKFADDTDLIVPAKNSDTCMHEIANIESWSAKNNQKLNCKKSKEIIFCKPGTKNTSLPPVLDGIERTTSIKTLGVTLQNNLRMRQHVDDVLTRSSQSLYALRILKTHGLSSKSLHTVFKSITLSKILYAAPAWWGFTQAEERARLESFIRKSKKFEFCDPNSPTIREHIDKAESSLFQLTSTNPSHSLHSLLPPVKTKEYNLRQRKHNFILPGKSNEFYNQNFLMRQLYKNCY